MRVFRGPPPAAERAPCALTIGNFDGVHRGHRALLGRVVEAARARGLLAAAMTFEPHPREFFTPQAAPARVANIRDKLQALAATGLDRVFVQPFTRRFAALSAEQFVEQVLIEACQVRWLLVGHDFRFGARRTGDIALLRAYAARGAFEVHELPVVADAGERVSSSAVRAALAAGDLERAAQLLGHAYTISGRVMHGAKLGRSIGFPTLNLRVAGDRSGGRPALQGVYTVRVHGLAPKPLPGVASLGLRPTVDTDGRWLLEVHLFDFTEQVYGRLVQVEFVHKLRDEERYDTLDELVAAISRDAERARSLLEVPRGIPAPP
jgi:riboflavin kinase/FMN adenylyltransferase